MPKTKKNRRDSPNLVAQDLCQAARLLECIELPTLQIDEVFYTSNFEKTVILQVENVNKRKKILASIISRAKPDASAFRLISRRALAHGFRPMM